MWRSSMTGPANESTEDAETLKLLWKPNLEIYGLQVDRQMLGILQARLEFNGTQLLFGKNVMKTEIKINYLRQNWEDIDKV